MASAGPGRSAVVVGAGVGGLAAAGGLARTGWRVTLLERDERLRAAPSALLLWRSGVQALRALGVGLEAVSTPVPDHGLRRPDGRLVRGRSNPRGGGAGAGLGGSWLVQPGSSGGAASDSDAAGHDDAAAPGRHPGRAPEPLLVHAQDLHDALVAGVGDRVRIETGVMVTRLTDQSGVTDGRRSWDATLVVAADGVDSVLRLVLDRRCRLVSAGAATWRAVIPWYRAPQLPADRAAAGTTRSHGYEFFSAALGERSGSGASGRGGLFWRATVTGAARPEPPATQLTLLRRWFAGWPAPVGELLAATEPGDLVQHELRTLSPPPQRLAAPRGDGAVVLLGDAGHAMAEHLGQGACLALADAALLVSLVREPAPGPALHTAVEHYDRQRRRRAAEVRRWAEKLSGTGPLARLPSVHTRRRDRVMVELAKAP